MSTEPNPMCIFMKLVCYLILLSGVGCRQDSKCIFELAIRYGNFLENIISN